MSVLEVGRRPIVTEMDENIKELSILADELDGRIFIKCTNFLRVGFVIPKQKQKCAKFFKELYKLYKRENIFFKAWILNLQFNDVHAEYLVFDVFSWFGSININDLVNAVKRNLVKILMTKKIEIDTLLILISSVYRFIKYATYDFYRNKDDYKPFMEDEDIKVYYNKKENKIRLIVINKNGMTVMCSIDAKYYNMLLSYLISKVLSDYWNVVESIERKVDESIELVTTVLGDSL